MIRFLFQPVSPENHIGFIHPEQLASYHYFPDESIASSSLIQSLVSFIYISLPGKTIDADPIFSCVFFIPRFSIISLVSRNLRVSKRKLNSIHDCCILQLHPWWSPESLNDSLFSFNNLFNKVDLPVFGLPIITTRNTIF